MKQSVAKILPAIVLLAAVLLVDFLRWPGFFRVHVEGAHLVGSVIDILNRASPVAIISCGMSLVIATGGVDLSVGAVMAIAGSASAVVLSKAEAKGSGAVATVPALIAGLLAGSLGGAVNAVLICLADIQPIIATLLLMVAGRGVAQLIADGQIITFENRTFGAIGSGDKFIFPNPVWIALAVVIILGALVRLTSLGLFIEASGSNPVASRLSGVKVGSIKALTYITSGLLAGLAGIIMAADIKAADANNAGLYFELDAILAVSLGGASLYGGKFSIIGTVVGAILMQTVTTTVNVWGIDKSVTLILKGGIVVAVCVLQSPVVKAKFERRSERALAS